MKGYFFIFGWLITLKHKYSKREIKMLRLEDVARDTETIFRGLQGILRIRRLRRSFCGAHGGSATHSSLDTD